MPLTAGTQLGSHEILSLLGKGEVYRARDNKLKRDVALKVLPEEFSLDPERVSRFQREAEVLASLNHTNIAGIYDVQEANDLRFLIMELVEGETLAEHIARGPLPMSEVLQVARQICEALEAAHEKGIIHRDLKPANIKITSEGQVKVLDFGLAKAFEAEAASANLSKSPTLSLAATNAGMILGTAAYMSPEQARGRPVDKRTDIFAFGCVLYEMLTGSAAFAGEDTPEILSRVLQRDPDWTLLPSNVPSRIREMLRLCLEKNAKNRRADATDVRLDIEQASAEPAAAIVTPPARTARLAWIAFAAALLAAVALAIPAARYLREAPPLEMRTDIVTPATTDPTSFAISPDGRQLVFAASGDGQPRLWLRPLDKVTAQSVVGTEGANYPFWSPDSRSVGFFANGKLKRIDLAGGSPQTLTDAVNRGGSWNSDGIILFERTPLSPIFRIPASGGEPVAVTRLERQIAHRFPQFLADGRQFIFHAVGAPETQGIYLGSLDTPEIKRLTTADSSSAYTLDGWLLFIRAGTLLAQRLDLTRRELTGDPMTVADPVGIDGFYAGAVSVSPSGLLAYRAGATRRQLTWFDRAGKALGVMGAPDENNLLSPSLSPDGRRVAVFRTVQGNADIWILDADRTTRFTFDASADRYPVWSPDGSRILFDSTRKGRNDIYQKASSGAGNEELLVESAQDKFAGGLSPDGHFLSYISNDPQSAFDIWMKPLGSDRKPSVFLKTTFDERGVVFSPDGRWVTYFSNESGRYESYVRPFPGPGGQWQVSTAGGISPQWGPGGKELYYIAPDANLMAVPIAVNGATIEPGRPVPLFRTRIVGGGTDVGAGWNYVVARDGRFLINTVLEEAASPITLLMNWKPSAR